VPGFVSKSALMRSRGPASRPLMGGLRRVSLLVPETSAEGLGHLAREFRARHRPGMAGAMHGWRRLSPSAELSRRRAWTDTFWTRRR
jgi:hypothetical protein